jgi:mannosyltransferase OCH1-like enzyme
MDKVTQLYYNLENNIPFCFIKLNDGEISAMIDVNSILSRSDERSSLKLSEKIKECLEYNRENYFIGLPCCLCYNNLYNESNKYITNKEEPNKYILNANILINTNIDTTIEIFTKTMNEKNIVIVTNANNVKNIHKLKDFNINPYKIIIVSEQFAFENDYERIKDEYKSFNDGDIILCLCGPLGRVLCYEWFKFNNSLTCLELGSLFDPLLRNRAYGYHTGIHKYCSECYPSHETNDCKLMILCDTNIYKECYYFYEEQYNFLFFDNNIKKINKNNNIRLEKEPKNNYLLKIKELVDSKINSKKNIQLKLDNGMKEFELDESKPRDNDYKHLNKNELLNACEIAYGSRHLETLNYISKLYLSFFEEFNEKETNKVRFFYGFSNYYNDRKLSKREFKKVYNSNIEDEYSFYAKCNLDTLYVKNNLSIPKIIHLIYFKGIDFEKFHYECIQSMLINMPNYKIIIYNDIEPENNKFWDDIKKNPMVSIEYISPPDHFDGFPLKFIQYKADVVRLELLYKYGGIYLDLDMLIIKNFENIINTGKDLYISEEGDKGGGLINAFLACKPNNGFVKKWLDSFKTGLRMDNWAYHIRESNKQLLKKKKHYFLKYNIEILESKHFFPFKWSEREKFLNINDNLNEDIYGIHLFETILHNDLINNPYFASNNNCITINI